MRGFVVACALIAACGDDLSTIDASPPDGGAVDLPAPFDGASALGAAFTVIGCDALDQSQVAPRCTVTAPAELTFVPLAAGVSNFVWTFTGADPDTSRVITPTVRYAQAGVYPVSLAASGAGGTTVTAGMVEVLAGAVGAACARPDDCAAGLTCVCSGDACPGALALGLCTVSCAPASCGFGQVCADLARGFVPGPIDAGVSDAGTADDWRRPLCLTTCTDDANCRSGFTCREVPALNAGQSSSGSFTWKRACFADPLGDIGDSCLDPNGQPDDARCLSGRCDPLGARGLCTADCATVMCPAATGCAAFTTTPSAHQCLRRCDAQHPCSDPLLACVAPGGAGNFGFTVSPTDPAGTTYCAPKPCTMPADCAPAGTCTANFCTR
jgi:PKD repeat protein